MKKDKVLDFVKGNRKADNSVIFKKEEVPINNEDRAKKKVEEIMDNVEVHTRVVHKEELKDNNSVEWLEEQLFLLTNENEKLKFENDKLKKYDSNVSTNIEINRNLILLFNELQNNYLGLNNERTRWTTVNIEYMVKRMVQLFPFLDEKLKLI